MCVNAYIPLICKRRERQAATNYYKINLTLKNKKHCTKTIKNKTYFIKIAALYSHK